jgi:hypothetical protein
VCSHLVLDLHLHLLLQLQVCLHLQLQLLLLPLLACKPRTELRGLRALLLLLLLCCRHASPIVATKPWKPRNLGRVAAIRT